LYEKINIKKRPSLKPKTGVTLQLQPIPFGSPAASVCWPVALRLQVTLGLPFRRSCLFV